MTTNPTTLGARLRRIAERLMPTPTIRFVMVVTLLTIVLFSGIRLALLVRNTELLATGIDNTTEWILRSFWMGVRFDIAYTTKLMLLPLVLLLIGRHMGRHNRWIAATAKWFIIVAMTLSIFVDVGDIPFFEYSNSHVNAIGISYLTTDFGQAAGMVVGESAYLGFAITAIAVAIAYAYVVLRIARHYRIREVQRGFSPSTAIYAIIMAGLIPLTARGMTFQGHPMHNGDAIISNNNFLNQLSINPVEPFFDTLLEGNDRTIDLMDSQAAYRYMCQAMGRDNTFTEHVEAKPSPFKNLVIIIQEGNCAKRLAREGHTKGLLPNLDRLITEGLYFENTYSSSAQTCYGIYGIVASLPPILDLHPLKDGLQHSLNTPYEQVYRRGEMTTLFYITHRPDFDNVNGFVTTQGFERLTSEPDYDFKTNKMWGVDDHIMFDCALKDLDAEHRKGKSFATLLLTCSNHRPFDAPDVEGFEPTSTDPEEKAIQYADWAMNRFLEMASKREWFDETLFVITSDHGRHITEDYIVTESVFHIPLLFYAPKHIAPEVRSDLVAQADITPTAFSMMGLEYDNHGIGIDLLSDSREYVVYTTITHYACRDHKWLYAHNPAAGADYLYDLEAEGNDRLINLASEHPDIVDRMQLHAKATIQTGWDIHNTVTAPSTKQSTNHANDNE